MGISINSHGKKVDKGTQSPLLKIFKEIMTREKDDPEKRNLLMEQKEDKKRRQYSGSRSKADRRSCEFSSSEHRKRGGPYRTSSTEQRAEFRQSRPQSMPYQSEKKDSWWFWQKDQKEQKQTEDTCSCVSCALKRLVSSEYACVACLLLLFTISIIVAFLVVFKSVPSIGGDDSQCTKKTTTTTTTTRACRMADSERLKRKIEMLNDNQMKSDLSGLDEFRASDKKGYDDALSGHIGIPGMAGIDFGPSFRELNSLDENEGKLSSDIVWSNVLETDKTTNLHSSDKLREFYKKLVQTDAKIKNLKRINQGAAYVDQEEGPQKSPERSKRSLKLYNYPQRYVIRRRRSTFNKDHKENGFMRRKGNKTRLKRFSNESDEPTGFVIEKKKLIVQYKPAVRKKVPVKKCSHAPKDSHTHENQLKHPFYKNTQRLDELLDRFLNKNLPEIMSDPFGLDLLFKPEKFNKCKHPPNKNVNIINQGQLVDQIPKPRGKFKKIKDEKKVEVTTQADLLKMLRPESSTTYEKEFYHHEVQMIGKEKQKVVTASPNDFEVLLSVSTIMNPDLKNTGKAPSVDGFLEKVPLLDKVPHIRRLMQLDGEDDENLGYEDFKEVLTDDLENHDDMDKTGDRKKRKDEQQLPMPTPPDKFPKYNPPGVHNPNWKGPMPLYPDELNSMIRHSALNSNKIEIPTTTHEIQSEFLQRKGRDLSDIEYVEDYLKNKYDKLVEMAQAYSDYGVLDGKKESRNEKNSPADETATDHRIKLAADEKFFKAGLLGRLKRGRFPNIVTGTPRPSSVRRQRDVSTTNDNDDNTEQTEENPNTLYYSQTSTSEEGLRIELQPTTKVTEDDIKLRDVMKILSKHVKIQPSLKNIEQNDIVKPGSVRTTIISSYPDMELVYSPKVTTSPQPKKAKNKIEEEKDNGIIFALSKGRRNLLSTDFKSTITHEIKETTLIHEINEPLKNVDPEKDVINIGKNSIDTFVQNLSMKRFNVTNERALARYIERMKQKNIRIYSTAHPVISNVTFTENEVESVSTLSPLKILEAPAVISKPPVLETVVTINKSEVRMDDYTGNNFQGKILLTVENPDIGVEHIDLMFDVPLIINLNDELMMMSDNLNFPNIYNQFEIFTETTTDVNEIEFDTYLGPDPDETFENKTYMYRKKRHNNVTEKYSNVNTIEVNDIANFTSNSSINLNVSLKNNRSVNGTDADMTLSDFFMMVSDWFKALEGVKIDKPRESPGSDLTTMLLKMNSSNETNETNLTNNTDTAYPIYDSDMIENIGHRSRVLLSIDNLANATDDKKETRNANITRVKNAVGSGGNVSSVTNSSTFTTGFNTNITTPKKDEDTKTSEPKRDGKLSVKAIFKRNADDSNLIFWNDIYDDEYGIQADKFDNSIRDKHSVKENDFIKRSGRWVHDKIKKFAENLKINPRPEDMEIKERIPRSIKKHGLAPYPRYVYDKIYDRFGRKEPEDQEDEEYDMDQKSLFTALSTNMKDVCKKAAKAVQQTRNIEVREDSKQGSIASTLMQQLVRLLTDLVDYQVQQKTCTKLPSELQNFLEWLTFPKEDNQDAQAEGLTYKTPFQEEDLIEELELQSADDKPTDHPAELATQVPGEKQIDVRTHFLDCLHSVQDLLDEYEDMSDDEKSKMTGVKSYLENQMKYLNKQLSGYDLFTLFEKHTPLRYKRDLPTKKRLSTKHRPRRKLNKFIKNFGKKHTRTTAGFDDEAQVTDKKRHTDKNEENIEEKVNQNFDEKVSNDVKRNLKDVYYKAVAEAKKYATAKNVHKKDEITHFESSTAKIKE